MRPPINCTHSKNEASRIPRWRRCLDCKWLVHRFDCPNYLEIRKEEGDSDGDLRNGNRVVFSW